MPMRLTFCILNARLDFGIIIVISAYSDMAQERSWQAIPNPPFIIGGNSHPNISTFGTPPFIKLLPCIISHFEGEDLINYYSFCVFETNRNSSFSVFQLINKLTLVIIGFNLLFGNLAYCIAENGKW